MRDQQSLISLIGLFAALFLASSMIMGDCSRQRLLKKELGEIQAGYDGIRQDLRAIEDSSLADQAKIYQTINLTYSRLDSLEKQQKPKPVRRGRTPLPKKDRVSGFDF